MAEYWPGQEAALSVFLHSCSQWRALAGTGSVHYMGLDRTAVHSVMQMLEVDDKANVLQQVAYVEAGALEVLNQKH